MACCYKQSRKCSDGSPSGLWLDSASIPSSGAIKQGDTCYSFSAEDQSQVLCHGTLHSGYSSVSGCDDAACTTTQPCPCCSGTTPAKVRIDLSSVLACNTCKSNPGYGFITYKTTGSLGVYDLPFTCKDAASGECIYKLSCVTDLLFQEWVSGHNPDNTGPCTGTPYSDGSNFFIRAVMTCDGTNTKWTVDAYYSASEEISSTAGAGFSCVTPGSACPSDGTIGGYGGPPRVYAGASTAVASTSFDCMVEVTLTTDSGYASHPCSDGVTATDMRTAAVTLQPLAA